MLHAVSSGKNGVVSIYDYQYCQDTWNAINNLKVTHASERSCLSIHEHSCPSIYTFVYELYMCVAICKPSWLNELKSFPHMYFPEYRVYLTLHSTEKVLFLCAMCSVAMPSSRSPPPRSSVGGRRRRSCGSPMSTCESRATGYDSMFQIQVARPFDVPECHYHEMTCALCVCG